MTTLNREVFHRDPTAVEIPNLGVAKVERPSTPEEWAVLEWELQSFVCSGEYERGLERILSTFLSHLSQPQQPAVWVSGFYGSGKSHLVRVLEHLWGNIELPNGRSARDLVDVPDDIGAHLLELTNAGKREGGVWSAAGTMGAGTPDKPRLAFLSIVFGAAGLPEQYGQARLAIWLRKKGWWEGVERRLQAAGADISDELLDMHVSTELAEALSAEVHGWADSSIDEIHQKLRAEYPAGTEDIGDDEFVRVLRDVLELQSQTPGKLPLTLVVLDEMREYLHAADERVLTLRHIAERCSAEFGSSLVIVATGQSALTADPVLQPLMDRFSVTIHLADQDVETVIRQVVTRKRADRLGDLESVLEQCSGEIHRQLGGTLIEPVAGDAADLVPDYPILPTRRRFWERVLRAIDRAGKAGVLRTQLKLVHEASQAVAGEHLGHVVGADFVFFEEGQRTGMLMSGALPREIDNRIAELRDPDDGDLKARICAMVFLISQLPREGAGDTGVRATAPMIADLLVEDLASDGGVLRRRVPEMLEELADPSAGVLMRIGDEYRLQTEEGAEWEREFARQRVAIANDPVRLAALRTEALRVAFDDGTRGLRPRQGLSKTPRKVEFFWDEEPDDDAADVPVWVRTEWGSSVSQARSDAADRGNESPVVHVFIPRKSAEAFDAAMLDSAAAQVTLDVRPPPQTEGGQIARDAMRTRQTHGHENVAELAAELMASAIVMQGGGAEVEAGSLRDALIEAIDNALTRKFPRFHVADRSEWGRVVQKAQEGDPEALEKVGHQGKPETHSVIREVLDAIGGSGVPGSDLHKRFEAAPYGWPRDAVDAAVLVAVGGRWVRAQRGGLPVDGVRELTPRQIGTTEFFKDEPPLSVDERLRLKGVLSAADIDYEAGHEERSVTALLQRLADVASEAGGPPPLPETPDLALVERVKGMSGNAQAREIATTHQELKESAAEWKRRSQLKALRLHQWDVLLRLLAHGSAVSDIESLLPQREAVQTERRLLDEPDPVGPLVVDASSALRLDLDARVEAAIAERRRRIARLEEEPEWGQLDSADAERILNEVGLGEIARPHAGLPEELLQSLDRRGLNGWDELAEVMSRRAGDARALVAELVLASDNQSDDHQVRTVRVSVPGATIRTPDELNEYLEAVRAGIEAVLDDGDIAVI